jgi:molybdopterin-guanine dinucleotide biosynthesis protein A
MEYIVRTLRPLVRELYLLGRADQSFPGFSVVADARQGVGPAAGIESLLGKSRGWALAIACDMPAVTAEFLRALQSQAAADAVIPVADGIHPTCALYHARTLPRLRAYLDAGGRSLSDWIGEVDAVRWVVPEAHRPALANHNVRDISGAPCG